MSGDTPESSKSVSAKEIAEMTPIGVNKLQFENRINMHRFEKGKVRSKINQKNRSNDIILTQKHILDDQMKESGFFDVKAWNDNMKIVIRMILEWYLKSTILIILD